MMMTKSKNIYDNHIHRLDMILIVSTQTHSHTHIHRSNIDIKRKSFLKIIEEFSYQKYFRTNKKIKSFKN